MCSSSKRRFLTAFEAPSFREFFSAGTVGNLKLCSEFGATVESLHRCRELRKRNVCSSSPRMDSLEGVLQSLGQRPEEWKLVYYCGTRCFPVSVIGGEVFTATYEGKGFDSVIVVGGGRRRIVVPESVDEHIQNAFMISSNIYVEYLENYSSTLKVFGVDGVLKSRCTASRTVVSKGDVLQFRIRCTNRRHLQGLIAFHRLLSDENCGLQRCGLR